MQNQTTFIQFLGDAYKKILQACLQDQAIETLKILENKEYLLNRVNELFTEIYREEQENKIQELSRRNQELLKARNLKEGSDREERCLSCQAMQNQMFALQKEKRKLMKELSSMSVFQEKQSKKLDEMLISQNQEMQYHIKKLQDDLKMKRQEWDQQRERLSRQLLKLKVQSKAEREESQKMNITFKDNLSSLQEEKQKLQKQVYQYLQQKGKEERDIREFNAKIANLTLAKEKQATELTMLKSQNSLLQQKIARLEQANDYLKSTVDNVEKENKILQKKNQEIVDNMVSINSKTENNSDRSDYQWSSDLLNKYNQIQKVNLELQKQNRDLKLQLQSKSNQYHEITLAQQKNIITTSEELNKTKLRYEREIREHREQLRTIRENIKNSCEESQQNQISILVKKYQTLLSEKDKTIERLTQQTKKLSNSLIKNQQLMADLTFQSKQEKRILTRELDKLKQSATQLKKHNSDSKTSSQLLTKETQQKLEALARQKQQLMSIIQKREKQIKINNKQISKLQNDYNTKQLMMAAVQRKYEESRKNNQELEAQIRNIKDSAKEKERILKGLEEKMESVGEEKEYLQGELSRGRKLAANMEEKIRRLEKEVTQKREMIVSLEEGNKNEVIDLYDKTQVVAQQSRKQLESYYLTLLKNQEEKAVYQERRSLQKAKQEQISQFQQKNKDLQDKMKRFKTRYSQQQKQRETLEQKIIHLFDQIDALKNQNKGLIQQLCLQKKENVKIIRAYQQKMMQYYRQFGQFKKELYINMREELQKIKTDLKSIVLIVQTEIQKMREYLTTFSYKVAQEVQTLAMKHQISLEKVRHQYEYGTILKLEEEKREAQVQFQMRVKQQSMEFYTILAEKQHIISALETKEGKLMTKIGDIQLKNDQIERIAREATKKQEELKQIVSKMNQKVNQAERTSNLAKNEVEYLKRENMELKKEILSLETNFKEKIQKCRQNYSTQNQRLFSKYEKQFSKFIASNKKSLEYSMLSQSKSSNNLLIPTKGCQNDDKLQKIQKQIQEQKKKLNMLEKGADEKGRMDKTFKMGADRDVRKIQRTKK